MKTPELSEAASKCPIVAAMLKAGETPDAIILILVKLKVQLLKDVEDLTLMAPKRVRMPDGSLRIWRCPEELIPEREKGLPDVAEALWELPHQETETP